MRGDLIRVLSSVEEKANELKLDGYEPDVVLLGKKAYEFIREQLNEEFGDEEEVFELSGFKIRVVEELEGDAVVADSKALGLGPGGAKRFKVVL
ncbi:family 4A encapsulin nanocompartment shell protein [Thermococcus thermotolerans]|uniref:family 4A encapsulin nanocompartment shell protein n=1 Tax=Thermococcus thermotolerans TaxID=2969672 RepID=UPI00215754A8|nr:family 4A encapsulin nanocompartment shell protein [Thermococcus thermotolerans]